MPSARFQMRDATADLHRRVDELFSRADLGNRDDYRRFLAAQAAAHFPVERALEEGGIADIVADWPARRRRHLIEIDLAALGMPLPPLEEVAQDESSAALLGAAYVLEGSRLGGTYLARSVGDGFPQSFLAADQPGGWRAFVALLDEKLATPRDLDLAAKAASDVFAIYERSARRWLGLDQG